jgi:NAD/NADP transhydrogenase alpha subunit
MPFPVSVRFIAVSVGPRAYSAISGMVGIGGVFVMGGGYFPGTTSQALGALSVLLASVNVAGGFVITKRMLDMFKSNDWFTAVSDFSY